jgi:predicted phosphate transport protein (TIGR00153 family)
VRFRLTPQDTSFYDLFQTSANHLVVGAQLLTEVMGAPRADREALSQKMREAEHAADESTHEIMRRVNSSFITPFDREDIYALASTLDDCMDLMEAAVDLIVLYRIDELPAGVSAQVEVLSRMAELTVEAMPRLRAMKDLSEYWIEINRLENQADQLYRRLQAELSARPVIHAGRLLISAGVAELRGQEDSVSFFQRADEALYRAKGGGKGRAAS